MVIDTYKRLLDRDVSVGIWYPMHEYIHLELDFWRHKL